MFDGQKPEKDGRTKLRIFLDELAQSPDTQRKLRKLDRIYAECEARIVKREKEETHGNE